MATPQTFEQTWAPEATTIPFLVTDLAHPNPRPTYAPWVEETLWTIRFIGGIFNSYIELIFLIMGIFGNVMSMIIFTRNRKKDSASATYLFCLAISDSTTLMFNALPIWIERGIKDMSGGRIVIQMQTYNDVTCKICRYFWFISICMSSWIIITFSLERVVAIWMPLKRVSLITESRRKKVICILLCVALVVSVDSALINEIKMTPVGRLCNIGPKVHVVLIFIYHISLMGLTVALPLTMIVFLNIALVYGIVKSRAMIAKSGNKTDRAERKCVINLVCVSTLFLITMSPFLTLWSYYLTWNTRGFPGWTRGEITILYQLAILSVHPTTINYSMNFVIYTCSLDFYRKELVRMITCSRFKKAKKQKNAISMATSATSAGMSQSEVTT
jgi:hypothetical protein